MKISSARFSFALLIALITGMSLHSVSASQTKVELPAAFEPAAVDAFIASTVAEKEITGLSVTLVKNGQIVVSKGYGFRSIKDRTPVTTSTRFAIGSVTKQFACACILLLAEQGKLSVDDKVAKYYPKLTRAADITLLDLMNHTSGYPDYYPLDFVDRRMQKPISADELIEQYAGGKLDFEPGTRYSYSNTGYIILGRIVEKVSGQSFGAFLEKAILNPLGMRDTVYDPNPNDVRYAVGHASLALGPAEPAQPEARDWLAAAGGIYSTALDLAKWNLAVMEGKVFRPDTYKLFSTARELTDGRSSGYGCGVSVSIRNGRLILTHSGAVSGFNAWSGMVPSTKSAVIVLCNQEAAIGSLPSQILGLLLKEESNVPKVAGPPAVEAARSILIQMQRGQIRRSDLGEEFNEFLTPEKVRQVAESLKPLGEPLKIEISNTWERGGMEVNNVRFTFATKSATSLLYRSPDGKIQQFLIWRE